MFSPNQFNSIMQQFMSKTGSQTSSDQNGQYGNNGHNGNNGDRVPLRVTPSKALVIAGLLSGSLEVFSVLVDKNQAVEILLTGTLKQKTELDKMLDKIGDMPFDEVLKAFLDRFS